MEFVEPLEAAEEVVRSDDPEVDWDSTLDEDDMEFVAEKDPDQPIKAIEEVGHSDADECQFEVEETFFGDEAEDTKSLPKVKKLRP